jgi:hypothetical protein
LHQWKSDLLRIWIPLIAGAAMVVGLFGDMEIQGYRDAAPTVVTMPTETSAPTAVQSPKIPSNRAQVDNPKPQGRNRGKPDPFEDGNGRIGRAIAEKAVTQSFGQPVLVSLATTILGNQKSYYDTLERANRRNEIT